MFKLLIKKIIHKTTGVVSIKPRGETRGCVLLSYDTAPFLRQEKIFSARHSNQWECAEIANILLNFGYEVDVIRWDNTSFTPKKDYLLIIDVHQNIERLSPFLKKDCVKIMHITSAHWLFQNHAEYTRLLELNHRRHVSLRPQRIVPPTQNIEYADYAIALGNTVATNPLAEETYGYAGKSISVCPISTTVSFDPPTKKDFDACRKNFIWLGGGGLVLKGLDIVLEYFKDHPEYTLTVCGAIKAEPDFAKAYWSELYETPNIKTVGMIDVGGAEFKEIITNSLGIIFPSASEGQSGSVVTALHAGLIPITSRESSVSLEPFGITLKDTSASAIEEALEILQQEKMEELAARAQKAWDYARKHHTRETFSTAYKSFIDKIITKHNL